VDKLDLVRLRDSYGREGKPYEDISYENPKLEDCLRIEEPTLGQENVYQSGDTTLRVCSIEGIDFFDTIEDDKNIMFLKGGIVTEYDRNVAGPGDIVSNKIIKELTKVFNQVKTETIIMVFE
jgi:hypothetical protein